MAIVPTAVIFVWDAVASVPAIDVLAVNVVKEPATAELPPITVPSIVPPFISADVIVKDAAVPPSDKAAFHVAEFVSTVVITAFILDQNHL